MHRYLPLIWKNALRNRRRTALTVASIAVSICLLGVLMAIYALLFQSEGTPAQALRLFTSHRVSMTQPLPVSYENQIERVAGVRSVMTWQWFGGSYKDPNDPANFFARFSVEPEKLLRTFPEMTLPDDERRAFESERTAAAASRRLADRYGWKLGDTIPLVGDIFPVTLELTLRGILDDTENREWLFFDHQYLRESLAASSGARDTVQAFVVQAESADQVPAVAKAIDALFESSPYPTTTKTERAFELSFVGFLGNLKLFLAAICGAVSFTILLVTGNTLSLSMRERIREIGVLKTLGFVPSAIFAIILGEAGVMALAGGAVGLVLAALLCAFIRTAPQAGNWLTTMSITPAIGSLALAVAAAIGVSSALAPALVASRISIVESLRHVG
jgi:putative ABC transport system permease protein